jgi:hypothetical protein
MESARDDLTSDSVHFYSPAATLLPLPANESKWGYSFLKSHLLLRSADQIRKYGVDFKKYFLSSSLAVDAPGTTRTSLRLAAAYYSVLGIII